MKAPRRRTFLIVGLLIAVLGGAAYVRYTHAQSRPEFTFDAAPVDRGKIVDRVTATGTLSALVTVQVGSQVSGRVQQLLVDFNSPVKKGQVIAKIDPQLFEAAYEQAKANYAAAQGNLTKDIAQEEDAQRQYERNKALRARNLIAQADLDTSQANYDAAKAQVDAARGSVEQAKAELRSAEVNLDYTTITSPTDGVVISRNVDVGQTVAASLQAPTLFVIAEDLRRMQVDTSVAESDVGKLTAGMPATFTVDAYPGDVFKGVVRQIRNAPQTVQNVVTYDAVIDVSNPDLKLKPGMTANATFVHAERDDALRVPNAALRFHPTPALLASFGGAASAGPAHNQRASQTRGPGAAAASTADPERKTIWVQRGERATPVRIDIGITDGTTTEVISGDLHEGDRAITDILSGPEKSRAAGGPAGAFRRVF